MSNEERTGFLYPFIEGDERDRGALLVDLARSADAKAADSAALQTATLEREGDALDAAATAMAQRFMAGGRLFTFGNGGSATDAMTAAALFNRPPHGVAFPARALVEDQAVLTALANDVGFDLVFSRQLIAHAAANDIALGISTSGTSRNVLVAFAEGKTRGLLTVGLAGYGGGEMATSDAVDHCIVVRSDSVHRTQESQAVLGFELWRRVQARVHG
ncbi:MAG: SIS domain-containing protein [Actinobacteria bacterium]|nr:SIS domain-containing protein [Actinomycetota bacterium]